MKELNPEVNADINFVPYRGPFTRGILATVYFDFEGHSENLKEMYQQYYAPHPFTWVTEHPVDLKQVVNTNNCFLQVEVIDGKGVITSVIDNLVKGASGQAVQNMNLMFGLDEHSGLHLKSLVY